jgi:hypothetical protein
MCYSVYMQYMVYMVYNCVYYCMCIYMLHTSNSTHLLLHRAPLVCICVGVCVVWVF